MSFRDQQDSADRLASVIGALEQALRGFAAAYHTLGGPVTFLVNSGPSKGGSALVSGGPGGVVHIDVTDCEGSRTVFGVGRPFSVEKDIRPAIEALFPLGGGPFDHPTYYVNRATPASSESVESSVLGGVPGAVRLTGAPGPVASAKDALLSTGGWALVAEGLEGSVGYAELVPGAEVGAEGVGAGPVGGVGPAVGPDAGVMAL